MNYVCGDNRFEIIQRYKNELISATNIESSPEEMAVLDNILFRFWQMGWMKEQDAVEPCQHDAVWLCGNCEQEVVGWDDTITCDEIRYPFCRKCGRSVKWNDRT